LPSTRKYLPASLGDLPCHSQQGQFQQRVQKNADALGRLVVRLGRMRLKQAAEIDGPEHGPDGRTMWLVFAGRPSDPMYSFNLIKLNLEVSAHGK
jgi:hypothetical protein